MGKDLSEMALEELWDLFPISLVKHDEQWNECFKEIESTIKDSWQVILLKESVTLEVQQSMAFGPRTLLM
jgi:hypothetical protein